MSIWSPFFDAIGDEYKVKCPMCNRYVPAVYDGKCKECRDWENHPTRKIESSPYE